MATALVTGCSSGFGLLTALELARRGNDVHATMRDLTRAGDLELAAKEEGLTLTLHTLDLADEQSVRDAVTAVVAGAGRIDVLVNNAGMAIQGTTEEYSDAEVQTIFDANFFGHHRVIRAALPHLRAQGSGTIINVTSVLGLMSGPFMNFYAASKFAFEALSESLWFELRPFGIKVVSVAPGGYRTAITEKRVRIEGCQPGSPYYDTFTRVADAVDQSIRTSSDPQEVATLLADIAQDPDPRFRYVTGADAGELGRRRGAIEDDTWMRQMAQAWGIG